jgi:hydroxyacylglutathione hydrolase
VVLDVRDDNEFEEEGHIPGARHLYVGYLDEHVDRVRKELGAKPSVAVTCSVGHRSGLAVSLLERHGFRDVKNLLGGMTAWGELELPTGERDPRGP